MGAVSVWYSYDHYNFRSIWVWYQNGIGIIYGYGIKYDKNTWSVSQS